MLTPLPLYHRIYTHQAASSWQDHFLGVQSEALLATQQVTNTTTYISTSSNCYHSALSLHHLSFVLSIVARPSEKAEREAIKALLQQYPSTWQKTIPVRKSINKLAAKGSSPKRGGSKSIFMTNQHQLALARKARLRLTRKPSAHTASTATHTTTSSSSTSYGSAPSDLAPLRPGRRHAPFDLTDAAPTPHAGTPILLCSQPVVDYLYMALATLQVVLDRVAPGRWFIWWGSALGCLRGKGMIPWDYDVDVVVLLPHKLPWDKHGLVKAFMENAGHKVHNVTSPFLKVHPPRPHIPSLFKEYFYRACERTTWHTPPYTASTIHLTIPPAQSFSNSSSASPDLVFWQAFRIFVLGIVPQVSGSLDQSA